MWLIAPRGMAAAARAEARATVEPHRPPSARRRAVKGYVGSILLVPHAVFVAAILCGSVPESISSDILLPYGLLGLVYGPYALFVMRGARKERALVRPDHGS